jgi:hypothetical protein
MSRRSLEKMEVNSLPKSTKVKPKERNILQASFDGYVEGYHMTKRILNRIAKPVKKRLSR